MRQFEFGRGACRFSPPMEALSTSTGLVALEAIGDKTQLLALVLAARFRKRWPIVWGILTATLANHAMAATPGAWMAMHASVQTPLWVLKLSFSAMAILMLGPAQPEPADADCRPPTAHPCVFETIVVYLFLAGMGDKPHIETVMPVASYDGHRAVVVGTTLGKVLGNAPVMWLQMLSPAGLRRTGRGRAAGLRAPPGMPSPPCSLYCPQRRFAQLAGA